MSTATSSARAAGAPTLDVRNLVIEARVGDVPIRLVDDISFQLEAGGTLAIVGESGCGKSMTALSLMRILPEPAVRIGGGRIALDGEDLARASEARMCQVRNSVISMIFQDPMASLNPVHTVGQQIVEAIRSHRDVPARQARAEAIALLRSVHLPDPEKRIDYYPHRLSGGMCQRVMIAMALAARPRVLIADEPTTALDTTVQAQVMSLLKAAQRDTGTAVVLITHNLAVAADAAQNVAVMYAGRIVEAGPVHEVFRTPRHPYTVGLLQAIPDGLEIHDGQEIPALVEIPGTVPRPGLAGTGCAFAPRCPRAQQRCREERPELEVQDDGVRTAACFYPHHGVLQ
ncbi:MAG: ABC transporter ATP-binding protein [Burkholderiales bacterium]|nr:ABC transporter ATP-binding protein [Burkholderiales bacterium]